MKLYDCTTAPSPRRIRIFAAEKGIELELVPVDLTTGEQFGDAFRAINPDCVVPALVLDDGSCLTEAIAICQYLEETHPEPALIGTTPAERATTLMWNAKAEQQGLLPMADAFRNTVKGLQGRAVQGPDSYDQIPALAERGAQRVQAFFRKLDARLADVEFVAGANYSMADITVLVFADFAGRMKMGIPEEAANLQRWYQSVASRPSASA